MDTPDTPPLPAPERVVQLTPLDLAIGRVLFCPCGRKLCWAVWPREGRGLIVHCVCGGVTRYLWPEEQP